MLLISAIALLLIVQILFGLALHQQLSLVIIGLLLLSFFTGFNLLEAMQPALISRLAAQAKGTALGVYNTMQALGLFTGGALGGMILKRWDASGVFFACSALLLVWLIIASSLETIPSRRSITTTYDDIA
jgi:predicted MFS family arabinose efflux permease